MSNALGVIVFIGVLILMVLVHEFGHYITAKKFGMKVEAYFFGFGPKIWSTHRGETEYGIRLLPLGGYVKITGFNPFVPIEEEDMQRTFGAKPAWKRAIVLVAGSATHFPIAFLLLFISFAVFGVFVSTTTVASVEETIDGIAVPAKQAGIKGGDEIVAVDGQPLTQWNELTEAVAPRPGDEVTITVNRDGQELDFALTLAEVPVEGGAPGETRGMLGVNSLVEQRRLPPLEAVTNSGRSLVSTAALGVRGVISFFSPEVQGQLFAAVLGRGSRQLSETENQPVGIVSVGRLAGEAGAAQEFGFLFQFLAAVVLFVAVLNLAPVPPLDGGWLLIVGIEKLFRRRLDFRKLAPIATVVGGLLLVELVLILYLDIARPISFQ